MKGRNYEHKPGLSGRTPRRTAARENLHDVQLPDAMVVCNKDTIHRDGIHGAPDLVVEVLSPGTAKNDKGYKKTCMKRKA